MVSDRQIDIDTHTHTHIHTQRNQLLPKGCKLIFQKKFELLLRKSMNKNYNLRNKYTHSKLKIAQQSKNCFNLSILNVVKEIEEEIMP